jgi:HAD superfamily hydrolase (TIGR01549 family)
MIRKIINNVFFDLWGTLAYVEQDSDIPLEIANILGTTREKYISYVKEFWFKDEISAEQFSEILVRDFKSNPTNLLELIRLIKSPVEKAKIYPDAIKNLLRLSSDYSLFLVSDTSSIGKAVVEKLDLIHYFKKTFFSCNYKKRKSEGLYKLVMSELKLNPKECLFVGDSLNSDYNLPRSLGAYSILINRANKIHGPDIIHNLDELK